MKKNSLGILVVAFALSFSCKETPKENNQVNQTNNSVESVEESSSNYSANSQNSLDWGGTYHGELPCASCAYIQTSISLNYDETYVLTTIHIGKEEEIKNTKRGNFKWIDGQFVELQGIPDGEQAKLYKVEENRLRQLDLEGNVIEGKLADKYLLFQE